MSTEWMSISIGIITSEFLYYYFHVLVRDYFIVTDTQLIQRIDTELILN